MCEQMQPGKASCKNEFHVLEVISVTLAFIEYILCQSLFSVLGLKFELLVRNRVILCMV